MRCSRFIQRWLVYASLAIVLSCLGGGVVRADIAVSGGSAAQQKQISDVYNNLPQCCRDGGKICVQVLNGHDMDAYIASGDPGEAHLINLAAVDGIYQNFVPTITLRAESQSTDLSCTFAHEYGHFIWQRHLTHADQRAYAMVYDHQRKARCLVTTYAAVSLEEGFAEAFSYYVTNKSVLVNRDSMSCCYLDQMTAECTQPAR